jgi:hypothetical protein
MTATYTFDVFSSLDSFGAASGAAGAGPSEDRLKAPLAQRRSTFETPAWSSP